jgi:signal transduction histidine kinase
MALSGKKPRSDLEHALLVPELREANERLLLAGLREQELVARLKRNLELRDHLLAVVSHDLGTPLAAVRLSTESLLEPHEAVALPPRTRASLENILFAANQMRDLVDQLGQLAQLESGRLRVTWTRTSMITVLRGALALLEGTAKRKSVRLEIDVKPEDLKLRCDVPKVIRVVANLVGNAVKFTPSGGRVCIKVRRVRECARVRVTDTGPGIARKDVPNLFQPYFRGTKVRRSGTGLGLYISKAIVEAHGGTIIFVPSTRSGACFELRLPFAPRRVEPDSANEGALTAGGAV